MSDQMRNRAALAFLRELEKVCVSPSGSVLTAALSFLREVEAEGLVIVEQARLEALERVVEEAKEIAHTPPSGEDLARNWAYWEFRKPDMQPLIEAVADLEAMER